MRTVYEIYFYFRSGNFSLSILQLHFCRMVRVLTWCRRVVQDVADLIYWGDIPVPGFGGLSVALGQSSAGTLVCLAVSTGEGEVGWRIWWSYPRQKEVVFFIIGKILTTAMLVVLVNAKRMIIVFTKRLNNYQVRGIWQTFWIWGWGCNRL